VEPSLSAFASLKYCIRAQYVRGISSIALVLGLGVALVLLLLAGLWPRWHNVQTAQAEASRDSLPAALFIVAKRGKPKADLTLPASLLALQETTIHARTNGYVKRLLVDIGDRVKTGQLLAEIEAPEVDRELDQARAALGQVKASLELARVTSDRYAALLGDEAVSPQEVDERRGIHEARQADYAAAKANIRRLEQLRLFQHVTAPFAGTIVARNVEVGTLIQGGASSSGWLFRLAQTDTIRVHVNVPQSSMRLIKPGSEGSLSVPELGSRTFAAKVVRSSGAFDSTTRTMVVEMHVPNHDGALLPGMYGQLRFALVNPEPSLQVPVNAVMIGGDGPRVATITAGDVVRIKPVKLGRDFGKEIEILEGLEENERVISNPRDNLAEGVKVRAVDLHALSEKSDGAKPASSSSPKPKS
jgi:RND family efflux transporter MFP subunit